MRPVMIVFHLGGVPDASQLRIHIEHLLLHFGCVYVPKLVEKAR